MADETKTLATADYRIAFDSGVEDVPTILPKHRGGTAVPQGKVEAVEEAAKEQGIKLRKL